VIHILWSGSSSRRPRWQREGMTQDELAPPALAQRLREARRARGLSQEVVSKELGMSRPTLIAVEQGRRLPRPEEIVTFARLYGRTVHELVRPSLPAAGLAAQFRVGVGTERNDTDRAVDELQRLIDDVVELETLVSSSEPRRYPEAYDIEGLPTNVAAGQLADAERRRLGLGDGPLPHLRVVLEDDVGLRVFFLGLPSKIAGLYAHVEPGGSCIAANARHPHERQRWTLAHEYGHFLTSRWSAEVTSLGGARQSARERFADQFAANLLMPQAGLTRRFQVVRSSRGGAFTAADLLQLADLYEVSPAAMALRMEDLRLVVTGWWDDLLARGLRVDQARKVVGIPSRTREVSVMPRRIRYLAVEAFLEGVLSEGQLARLLRVDRGTARMIVAELSASAEVDADGDAHEYTWDLSLPDVASG